jgi:hypothetical protein
MTSLIWVPWWSSGRGSLDQDAQYPVLLVLGLDLRQVLLVCHDEAVRQDGHPILRSPLPRHGDAL